MRDGRRGEYRQHAGRRSNQSRRCTGGLFVGVAGLCAVRPSIRPWASTLSPSPSPSSPPSLTASLSPTLSPSHCPSPSFALLCLSVAAMVSSHSMHFPVTVAPATMQGNERDWSRFDMSKFPPRQLPRRGLWSSKLAARLSLPFLLVLVRAILCYRKKEQRQAHLLTLAAVVFRSLSQSCGTCHLVCCRTCVRRTTPSCRRRW